MTQFSMQATSRLNCLPEKSAYVQDIVEENKSATAVIRQRQDLIPTRGRFPSMRVVGDSIWSWIIVPGATIDSRFRGCCVGATAGLHGLAGTCLRARLPISRIQRRSFSRCYPTHTAEFCRLAGSQAGPDSTAVRRQTW